MSKLAKNYYYGKNGERKVNCYVATISKKLLDQTDIKENDDIKIHVENNKIIIEKS